MLTLEPLRILIVDNDIDRREDYKQLLWQNTSADYIFSESDSIAAGLRACIDDRYNCILLDQKTAGTGGLDFIDTVSTDTGEVHPPVILLMDSPDVELVVQAIKTGAQHCLVKTDLNAAILQQAISDAVEAAEVLRSAKIKQEEFKRLAVTDDLTGLYSRRYLLEHLQQETHRASRYKVPFCILLVDLDHFKRVNDQHGHLAGDQVLKSFSNLLRKCTRQSDIVCRYGGEEFLIVLTNTLLNAAKVVAERIRMSTKTQTHCSAKGGTFQVTCSIGLTEYEQGIYDVNALINFADEALYRAKYLGRNRVCTWSNENAPAKPIHKVG